MKTLLLGDVCPTTVTAPLFKNKNISELFTDVVSIFDNKDFVFANLECALTEHEGKIQKFGPCLKAPKETAAVLRELGVDCCGLSNNHIFDYGIKGVVDTIQALNGVGIEVTGFGNNYEDARKNYTIEKNGEKICIIAVCEHEYSYALDYRMGSRPYDEYDTIEDIRSAKAEHDRVIVIYHGGKEFCRYPSPRLYKLCHAMARAGADIVLCQHSHCIGAYEQYSGCHILYGQGNFHFVMPMPQEGWHTGFAVEYDTIEHKISFVPIQSNERGISFVSSPDKEAILRQFESRNQSLINGAWKDGWHEFCESNKDNYIKAICQACTADAKELYNHRFAHYLDCEAHTDVWRELFPSYNLTNEI